MKAVDLFAGIGGWTCGAERAGVRVVWAANHWQDAVRFHAFNHPATNHACQDLHQADWSAVPAHDLLLASPCCQGHTRARGTDRPHHDASRSTAWAVVSCAEYHRPEAFGLENVVEFLKWNLYPAWKQAMEALGYAISENIIDAADCGTPQHRNRVFVIGTRSRHPLVIPKPSKPHVPASAIIDYSAGRWSPVVKPGRASKTIDRWQAGRATYGERFLFSYYGQTKGGRSLDRPIGTITTRDRWAVVDGDRMRMATVHEARAAMGFPGTYQLPRNNRMAMHMLGNAVCPDAAEYVVRTILNN